MDRRYEGPWDGAPPGGSNSRTRRLRGTFKGVSSELVPAPESLPEAAARAAPRPSGQRQRRAPQTVPCLRQLQSEMSCFSSTLGPWAGGLCELLPRITWWPVQKVSKPLTQLSGAPPEGQSNDS